METIKVYHGGVVIHEKERYVLTKPRNEWDTNYHLHDRNLGVEYLIDFEDVQDNESDIEEYGGILFSDFEVLSDIEEIKLLSWKIVK